MKLNLLNKNKIVNKIKVYDHIFNCKFNIILIHQILVSYKSNSRKGTRKQKDRSEVNHSTKKPWRQKGTGHARAGMTSSPLWRGGGCIFPNFSNENFYKKINKKMYKICISSIFSQLIKENRLYIIKNLLINKFKTKYFLNKIKKLKLDCNSMLIIKYNLNKNLILSSRNLFNINIINIRYINPISLLLYKNILLTKKALINIQKWLK